MNTWILIGIAWIGSWCLIAGMFFIWSKISTDLLKRRYKEENDRGRKIEDFGEPGRVDKGRIRGESFGVEEKKTSSTPTSSTPTSSIPTSSISDIEQRARTNLGESETERTDLFNGQEFYEPTKTFVPTGIVESSEGDFKEPSPPRKLSFSERRWKKD